MDATTDSQPLHYTLFDTLDYFYTANKPLRDRSVVKEFMKNAQFDNTVMIVFKLLSTLQTYRQNILKAEQLAGDGMLGVYFN